MTIKLLIGTAIIISLLILIGLFRTLDHEIEIVKFQTEENIIDIGLLQGKLNFMEAEMSFVEVPFIPFYLKDYLMDLAEKYDVDVYLAASIIQCESEWYEFAKNPNSTAKGYFQIIDSTWYETLKRMGIKEYHNQFNGELNLEAGFYMLSTVGIAPWKSSKHCWDN